MPSSIQALAITRQTTARRAQRAAPPLDSSRKQKRQTQRVGVDAKARLRPSPEAPPGALEARTGFEPAYDGFANRCLATWLPRQRSRDFRGAERSRRYAGVKGENYAFSDGVKSSEM